MILISKKIDLMPITVLDDIEKNSWIHLTNPSDNEIEYVSEKTGIDESLLKTALDEEETAQLEREDGNTMLVIDIPYIEEDGEWYTYNTIPFGIIYNEDYFVTVCLQETAIITDFQMERIKNFRTNAKTKLLLQLLNSTASKYLHHLRQIDRTSLRIQAKLHKSMKNKELLQLLDLEKSLVYFSTSLRANDNTLAKINRFTEVKNIEENQDYLEDVILEYKQAIEMCNIHRDILAGTMDAFASIISNNINVVMKVLTIITIALTIPTLISGLWGMNVPVPFANLKFAFWIVLGIIAVVTAAVTLIVVFRSNKMGRGK